jgi:hypothetical protein
LQQIAKGLRISAETLYVRAGFLEDRGATSDVVGAILADQALDDRHKRVLLDIYESFRAERAANPQTGGRSRPTQKATAKKAAAKRATAKKATAKKPSAKKSATTTTSTSRRTQP